ncbi:MAG: FecCD family ABC transporter permease [Betaproteobacteria bacterium]|jgi:iron complex transport system permease protein
MSRSAFPLLAILGMVLVAASLGVGNYPLGFGDAVAILAAALGGAPHGRDAVAEQVFWQIRLPRVLAAMLVGAALSASGACLQRVFRNPLAAPEFLGVSSGAALGAALAIVAGAGAVTLQASAFAGGLIAIALVLAIGPLLPSRDRLLGLVLTGVALSSLAGAMLAALIAFADPRSALPAISYWMLGSFVGTDLQALAWMAGALATALIPLLLLRWRADALALGDDEARALGVRNQSLRLLLVGLAALATSAAVAAAGIVGWVGLVVPHLARLMVGGAFARWLPASALLGAVFMLAIDTVCRAMGTRELPPGVLAALLGAPLLFVLMGGRRGR